MPRRFLSTRVTGGCSLGRGRADERGGDIVTERRSLLLANATISEKRWDAENQRMIYRVEYDDEGLHWPPRHKRELIEHAKLAYAAHMEQMLLSYPELRMTPWDDQDAAVREAWIEAVTPEESSFA